MERVDEVDALVIPDRRSAAGRVIIRRLLAAGILPALPATQLFGHARVGVAGGGLVSLLTVSPAFECIALVHSVGAVEHHVARPGLELGPGQEVGERHPSPFADGAPALDAIVPGDLGAGRKLAEFGEGQLEGRLHEAADLQVVLGELALRQGLVVFVRRVLGAVRLEPRRDVGLGVFRCQRRVAQEQALDEDVGVLAGLQRSPEPLRVAQAVAASEHGRRGGGGSPHQEGASVG